MVFSTIFTFLNSIKISILLMKKLFLGIFTIICKERNLFKNSRFTGFFFVQVQEIPINIFRYYHLHENYHFPKSLRQKCQKMKIVASILDFWRPSWIDNEYFVTLYSIYGTDNFYQFSCCYRKVNDRCTNCSILPILKARTGNSYLPIIPLILNQF